MKTFKIQVVCFIILAFLLFILEFNKNRLVSVIGEENFLSSNISLVPISYQTEYVYNDNVMYGKKKVIQPGVNGYMLEGTDNILIEPINEIIEVGSGYLEEFFGSTTGYGADCVGCSGTVACPTKSSMSHNLIRDGIYYNDSEYGEVRIVAATQSKFSCGTIMSIDNGIIEPFMAIVLDTGSAMRNAWKNGDILVDIAFSYENSVGIHDATNRSGNVKFKVYRNGW